MGNYASSEHSHFISGFLTTGFRLCGVATMNSSAQNPATAAHLSPRLSEIRGGCLCAPLLSIRQSSRWYRTPTPRCRGVGEALLKVIMSAFTVHPHQDKNNPNEPLELNVCDG